MTRAAGVVGFWTALSRVLGYVRDMVTALFLGAGFGADAFIMAFRIPNLLRRFSGEGALSAAFIPTFVETLQHEGRQEAAKLARITFTFTALVLSVITLAGVLLSPWIVHFVAPGFLADPDKFQLTVELNRLMFPYIFFISLVALCAGILNSMGHFSAPAAAPVVLNLSMIATVAFMTTYWHTPAYTALAWGVLIAGVLQLALQIPFMVRRGVRLWPDFEFGNPALKRIGVLFVPAAFTGAVYQINVFVGSILASWLPAGGVSWLYYADRVVELPLGIFAIALGTAVLPSMSRLVANGDLKGLTRSLSYSLRFIAFFTIPASLALIVLREPIVSILFQRGRFSATDTTETSYALLCYAVGLWAFSGLKVVTQGFFSLKDTRTPMHVSIAAVIVNLAAGLLLMKPMAQGGLALATSLSAAFNVVTLFAILVRRLGGFPLGDLLSSLLRISAASLVMAALLAMMRPLGHWTTGLTLTNLLVLSGSIAGGLAVFLLAAWVFKCRELTSLIALLTKRRR